MTSDEAATGGNTADTGSLSMIFPCPDGWLDARASRRHPRGLPGTVSGGARGFPAHSSRCEALAFPYGGTLGRLAPKWCWNDGLASTNGAYWAGGQEA